MKKTKKRVLGLLGLVLVAVTTIFAAFLPGPEASAEATSSITDEIVVRVVGSQPDILNIKPENGSIFVQPKQNLSFDYENVEYLKITIYYTDKDGVTHEIEFLKKDRDDPESFVDYIAGKYSQPLDLFDENFGFGYGEYRVHIEGIGFNNVTDYEDITFSFYPVYGTVEDTDDDLTYLHLHYDTTNPDIKTIGIKIYDEDGNLVNSISPITVDSPNTEVELPFSENDLATGNYRIEITAYGIGGVALYKPYITYYYYEVLPAPNTGGIFKNLNISRVDYLVTGLLIFLSAAVLGIIFVNKGKNNKKRASVRRRK